MVRVANPALLPRARRLTTDPPQAPEPRAQQRRRRRPPNASGRRGTTTTTTTTTTTSDEAEPQPEPSRGGRRPRGRPRAERQAAQQDAPETAEEAPRRKSGRRPSQRAEPEDQQPPDPGAEPDPGPDPDPGSAPSAPPSPPRPYVHVAPHVRRVRQSAIAAKWSPLAGASLSAVSVLLHLAHRPILQRLSGTHRRRAHTSAALRLVTHRIARKVARGLPFPPAAAAAARGAQQRQADGGRETELDFEAVLDGKALLEAQLGPAEHAVEVLRREKERVERELERDYEMLRGLEAGARAQAREQRGLLKKAHVLAPGTMGPEARDAQSDQDVVFTRDKAAASASASVFAAMDDDDLRVLAVQLGGHVDSMRANLQQTDGVLPQLARSRAALQAVLLRHLDQSQYERVVLG
ncbi:Uncharacterized protein TCAP_03951 [Tolypocladium capitatum]|uniref:Kinetochore protein fta7 n=1 Tax=Tolypocladium capitatum TaxID=45235 RepID=A0A2K3QEZ4_9HYPO|nr:Uncharacterized protein TCAP_03951 [Tolypocladium capitatum]